MAEGHTSNSCDAARLAMHVTETSMVIVGRRPGRPRAAEEKTSVSAWMPTRHVDELTKLANANNMSVSQFVGYVVSGYIQHRKRR